MNDFKWDELKIGMQAQFDVVLTADMPKAFALLSGDVNRLHSDADFAQRLGYPDQVVFGMLIAAFYSQLVGVHLPGAMVLLHGIDVDFNAPSFVGDKLTISGEIVFLNEAYRRIELKARVRNQAGKLISKATIRTGLHEA